MRVRVCNTRNCCQENEEKLPKGSITRIVRERQRGAKALGLAFLEGLEKTKREGRKKGDLESGGNVEKQWHWQARDSLILMRHLHGDRAAWIASRRSSRSGKAHTGTAHCSRSSSFASFCFSGSWNHCENEALSVKEYGSSA